MISSDSLTIMFMAIIVSLAKNAEFYIQNASHQAPARLQLTSVSKLISYMGLDVL